MSRVREVSALLRITAEQSRGAPLRSHAQLWRVVKISKSEQGQSNGPTSCVERLTPILYFYTVNADFAREKWNFPEPRGGKTPDSLLVQTLENR